MSSQWDNFLQNLGQWRGSFTGMNLNGEVLTEVPSRLTLEPIEGDRNKIRFSLCRYGNGDYNSEPTSNTSQVIEGLGRHTLFFETGAFSKGSMCLSSISPFIAEFGFIAGDRRMRMVQMYDDNFAFNQLVFIREFREGCDATERPPLTVEQLLGTWEATYYVCKPDFEPPTVHHSRMVLNRDGDVLHYRMELEHQTFSSTGKITGNQLLFTEGNVARQITLLPDGASMNVPPQLAQKQTFFVEAGWLISDNLRQRLMRNFNERGEWESSTLVIEQRVG